jgi:hypothetical protein
MDTATRRSMARCQNALAIPWFAGAGAAILVLVIQSVRGHYGTNLGKAWDWLLPTIVPTLTLIIGAVTAQALTSKDNEPDATVNVLAFKLCYGLSWFYIALILLTLLLQPFSGLTPLELMAISHFWLTPIQGLVGLALGVFFISRKT